jgi:hypothetical protein
MLEVISSILFFVLDATTLDDFILRTNSLERGMSKRYWSQGVCRGSESTWFLDKRSGDC